MAKDPYRVQAEMMTDPVSWPRWKFIIISAAWGLVGIVLTGLACGFSTCANSPEVDDCEDELIPASRLTSASQPSAVDCDENAYYAGTFRIDNVPIVFCQCKKNKELFKFDGTDASK